MSAVDCIKSIVGAVGRELTDEEIAKLYDDLGRQVRRMQAENRQQALQVQPEAVMREAAARAAQQRVAEAQLKKARTALAIVAQQRNYNAMRRHPGGLMKGLMSLMTRDLADRGSTLSAEARFYAVRNMALARLTEVMNATNPRFFGLIENPDGVRAVVKELFGESTGVKEAADAARIWSEVAEDLRVRFNASGGQIGKLEDWRMPQHHDQLRVKAAGRDKWVADTLPKLDRQKYVHDDGSLYNDAELARFLEAAYETISTGGLNKLRPGMAFGKGMIGNRHADHRAIHFKDADSFLAYEADYGGAGLWPTMIGHVNAMSRDIALVETFGPNPGHMVQYLRDVARKAGEKESGGLSIQSVYDELSGATSYAQNETLARFSQGLRNIQISAKLGGAVLSSVTDFATAQITASMNRLPEFQFIRNQLKALNPLDRTERDLARRAGLALDTMIAELHRWGEEGLGHGWTGKMASATMRASGLAALTDANKRAFGVTMMSAIGKLTRTDWGRQNPADLRLLKSKGVTEADWQVWQKARLEDWGSGNNTMLTPESILRIPDADLQGIAAARGMSVQQVRWEAATKLLGPILEESDIAVVTAGVRETAIVKQGTKAGTVSGELLRSIFLFKSFPIGMIARHWMRGMGQETVAGRAVYLSSMVVGTTVLGAVAMQAKDIAKGKDPRDMTDPRNWLAAMAQGGGLGIYGDFVLSDQSRFGNSLTETLAGPVVSSFIADPYNLTFGNIHQAVRGEDTHAAAELLRYVQGNTPLINLWYTRAAMDHMIFHQVQEHLSPGYLSRMKRRTQRETGQSFWWEPGEPLPERPPSAAALVGE